MQGQPQVSVSSRISVLHPGWGRLAAPRATPPPPTCPPTRTQPPSRTHPPTSLDMPPSVSSPQHCCGIVRERLREPWLRFTANIVIWMDLPEAPTLRPTDGLLTPWLRFIDGRGRRAAAHGSSAMDGARYGCCADVRGRRASFVLRLAAIPWPHWLGVRVIPLAQANDYEGLGLRV